MTNAMTLVCPDCAILNRVPADRLALQAKCGGCHKALLDGQPAAVDEAGFERHLRHGGIPILPDVRAPWCGGVHVYQNMRTVGARSSPHRHGRATVPAICTSTAGVDGRHKAGHDGVENGRTLAQTAGARDTNGIVGWPRKHWHERLIGGIIDAGQCGVEFCR